MPLRPGRAVQSCPVLSRPVLSCPVLSCHIPSWSRQPRVPPSCVWQGRVPPATPACPPGTGPSLRRHPLAGGGMSPHATLPRLPAQGAPSCVWQPRVLPSCVWQGRVPPVTPAPALPAQGPRFAGTPLPGVACRLMPPCPAFQPRVLPSCVWRGRVPPATPACPPGTGPSLRRHPLAGGGMSPHATLPRLPHEPSGKGSPFIDNREAADLVGDHTLSFFGGH